MATTPTCCGCQLADDYGTSIVAGSGDPTDPYSVIQVDPSFQRPVVKSIRAAAQSIPSGLDTVVTLQGISFDTDNMWDSLSPTKLTTSVGGLYLIGFSYQWAYSSGNVREVFLRLNGTTELERQGAFSNNTIDYDQTLNYPWYFAPGDYIEAVAFQTSGGNLALGVSNFPFLWMMYLGQKL